MKSKTNRIDGDPLPSGPEQILSNPEKGGIAFSFDELSCCILNYYFKKSYENKKIYY